MSSIWTAIRSGLCRAPDLIRFGFAPLYNTSNDVCAAADALAAILRDRRWDWERFKARAKVT